MRSVSVAVLALGAMVASGCLEPRVMQCGGGLRCPVDKRCAAGRCVDPVQLLSCEGRAPDDDSRCLVDGELQGRCVDHACLRRGCGDRIVDKDLGEQCDDGNRLDHDGCNEACYREVFRWTRIAGPAPPARSRAAMAYDPDLGHVVLFGGQVGAGADDLGADTWLFTVESLTWERGATVPVEAVPLGRADHAMAFDIGARRVVLHGGRAVGKDLGDTWAYDAPQHRWTPIAVESRLLRRRHALVWDVAAARLRLVGGGQTDVIRVDPKA